MCNMENFEKSIDIVCQVAIAQTFEVVLVHFVYFVYFEYYLTKQLDSELQKAYNEIR